MIFVGIDVASEKHDFFMFCNSEDNYYKKSSVSISNSNSGFEILTKAISDFSISVNDFDIRIGIESTGIYHQSLLGFLVNNNYSVYLLNPILTSRFAKAQSIHHAKNDNLDSKSIASFVKCNLDKLFCFSFGNYNLIALKTLNRERFKVVEQRKRAKIGIYNILIRLFPEFIKLFSNYCSETALSILSHYPNRLQLAKAHESSIQKLIHGHCHVTAKKIIEVAKNSIGNNDHFLIVCLTASINQYNTFSETLDIYDKEIKTYIDKLNPCITSIPGIGYINASFIIAEISDISRFKSADSLVSFAGLDLCVYESGKYAPEHSFPSKKGSHYLRYALYNASRILVNFDPVFSAYFHKKRDEGKHFYVALAHVQKKLLRVIFSMLKSGTLFNSNN